eukprot:TRINITY_DN3973_c0_g1_i1.p1 TRINITY_DN3973_c0_g1~~TRINITY_DN3973_c0_g1_i1.p1  ORF type:complete len:761 (-),score=198.74 TRINITY_DN3973_c0_g1_i1:63-2345(-)
MGGEGSKGTRLVDEEVGGAAAGADDRPLEAGQRVLVEVLERVAAEFPLPENDMEGCCPLLGDVLQLGEAAGAEAACQLWGRGQLPRTHGRVTRVSRNMLRNETKTNNFRKLLSHMLFLLREFPVNNAGVEQEIVNCLMVVRNLCALLVEASSSPTALLTFSQEDPQLLVMQLIRALALVIINYDTSFCTSSHVRASTLCVQVEALQLFQVLLVPQEGACDVHTALYGGPTEPNSAAVAVAAVGTAPGPHSLCAPLVTRLLVNTAVLKQRLAVSAHYSIAASVFPAILSSFATLLHLPLNAYLYFHKLFANSPRAAPTTVPAPSSSAELIGRLRELNVQLLLLLVHPSASAEVNECRKALNAIQDSHLSPPMRPQDHRADFALIYQALTSAPLIDDTSVLLLYFLLQGNVHFLRYILSRTDCDTLLLPLLRTLYSSAGESSQKVYMILVIILILSHDASFNNNLHQIWLTGVPWYREQYLREISVGGLVVVVLVRAIQQNLRRMRDLYLHTNCLAVLANMAPHFVGLPSYPAFKLVKLIELIVAKYSSLSAASTEQQPLVQPQPLSKLQVESSQSGTAGSNSQTPAPPTPVAEATSVTPSTSSEVAVAVVSEGSGSSDSEGEAVEDSQVATYAGLLHSVLDILCSALAHGLDRNPHLVYAILQQKNLFMLLSNEEAFVQTVAPLLQVIRVFENELQSQIDESVTCEAVIELIQNRPLVCSVFHRPMELIEYKYEEDPAAHEFFSGYVWGVVTNPACATVVE